MKINGFNLDSSTVVSLINSEESIELSSSALNKMKVAREFVLEMVESPLPIYGLNTGVGKNKDRKISKHELTDFNEQLIYAHCVGLEPYFSSKVVRAAMLIKLNSILKGFSGVQLEMAYLLRDFFNKGITPLVKSRGSVGQGDIGLMSYIGLGLLGKGRVAYQSKDLPMEAVMLAEGLRPLTLYAKDGLAIVSSNALSLGRLCCVLDKLNTNIERFDSIYAFSLEAFKGHLSPLDETVVSKKLSKGQFRSAGRISENLRGSYLFTEQDDKVQDPLSFRNAALIHGGCYDSLDYVRRVLDEELMSSEDNPLIDVNHHRIISTPHYDSLRLSLSTEMLTSSIVHLVQASIQRMFRLSEAGLTSLPRFLETASHPFFGLQTLQKTLLMLQTEILSLAQPVSHLSIPLAGNMEDVTSNFPKVLEQLELISRKLDEVMSLELYHAFIAISLRFKKPEKFLSSRGYHVYSQIFALDIEDSQLISDKIGLIQNHLEKVLEEYDGLS